MTSLDGKNKYNGNSNWFNINHPNKQYPTQTQQQKHQKKLRNLLNDDVLGVNPEPPRQRKHIERTQSAQKTSRRSSERFMCALSTFHVQGTYAHPVPAFPSPIPNWHLRIMPKKINLSLTLSSRNLPPLSRQ